MNEKWTALIGLLGVVVGALIQTFGRDLLGRIGKSKKQRDLAGTWRVTWHETDPIEIPEIISDTIVLTVSSKGRITARGANEDHTYKLEGWDSTHAVTLAYSGLDMEENIVGTVVLKKNVVNTEMAGYWAQISPENELVRGETSWKKDS